MTVSPKMKTGLFWGAVAAVIVAIGVWAWLRWQPDGPGPDFAASNGRIEAVDIELATKYAGRIHDIAVDEGDFVASGQVVAHMDTATLDAQLAQAKARVLQARSARTSAVSDVALRRAEYANAEAVVAQRKAEADVAGKRFRRARALLAERAGSQQELDDSESAYQQARATLAAARAQVQASRAAIEAAQASVGQAEASIQAAVAATQELKAELADSVLHAPRAGRIQYRVAQPGEVLAAGASVLSMVDLSDVYMTFFLPTAKAGRVALGAEARIVLDAAPGYVIPATISYVADVAQFTPKTVETAEERQKLTFRVKARIAPALLQQHLKQVKTGLPGMVYVRLNPATPWPADLQVKLPRG
ncbi:HlyD family secretion protein [Salinisphaera hydrothermalis]|nr:HlyD family efflux transporter periplasmic adaptor subunit [Salinisphaera hydrothermalis]